MKVKRHQVLPVREVSVATPSTEVMDGAAGCQELRDAPCVSERSSRRRQQWDSHSGFLTPHPALFRDRLLQEQETSREEYDSEKKNHLGTWRPETRCRRQTFSTVLCRDTSQFAPFLRRTHGTMCPNEKNAREDFSLAYPESDAVMLDWEVKQGRTFLKYV
ncbi:hypothetical protein HJG60_008072 [Phyllostomus discolor]|uniref:Uncharacterized protein n=1 Tax=Phyllostomus discolor TaxID=89673 RepID=A0A834BDQ1_9CHIR|nr:hypothetical protein HJG60_008072 [Phyllostomus discolor]